LIPRLFEKLPLRRKIVALIVRHFALLDSLAQQLADIIDRQRIAIEDRTQQLEASAQLIEIGRANAATLPRIQGTVLQLTKDLQHLTALEDRAHQLKAPAELTEITRANTAVLLRLEDSVLRLAKDLQQATSQLEALKRDVQQISQDSVSATARVMGRIEDGIVETTKDLKNLQHTAEHLQSRSAIYIPANAYESANPEMGLLTFLSGSLRGRVALDIGAHVGEVSDRLLDCGMSVHAFEPSPSTFEELSDRLSGRSGFTAHCVAVGYADREMDLYVASTTSCKEKYKDVREYNSLVRHSMVNDLTFTNTVKVKVRSLQSLHAAREIPDNIGIIKIDAEGYDLEIIRGMGDCTSDILMTEFWDPEHPFGGAGAVNRLNDLVRELQGRGFSPYVIIYRDATSGRISFYCNSPRSVRGSWGNAIFFKDTQLFTEACRWCASVMPATFFTS
jgi:FkbM family methyltransferase